MKDLVKYLHSAKDSVSAALSADFQKRRFANEQQAGRAWQPSVGDFVLLRRPPSAAVALRQSGVDDTGGPANSSSVSARLQPLTDRRLFRVKKLVGSKSYILEDPDTGCSEFNFAQPVALERLVPFEATQLETPVNNSEDLWIDIKSNKQGRHDRWLLRQIIGQTATGAVRLRSHGGEHEEVVELADYEWRWRAMLPTAGTDAPRAKAKFDPVVADRNHPYAHPRAGDTAAWKKVLLPLYRKYSPAKIVRLDEILAKYKGHGHVLHKAFLLKREGDRKEHQH